MKKIILTLCAVMFASVMVQAQDTTPKDTEASKALYQKKMELVKKAEADKAAAMASVEKNVDPDNPPSNNEAEKQRLTKLKEQARLDAVNKPATLTKEEREKNAKHKIDN